MKQNILAYKHTLAVSKIIDKVLTHGNFMISPRRLYVWYKFKSKLSGWADWSFSCLNIATNVVEIKNM